MSDIINTSINDGGGAWGSADTIKYDSSNIENIKSDIEMALAYLDEVKTQVANLETYDNNWKGEAKKTYADLKNFLNQYQKDYYTSVSNLKTAVSGLGTLINSIPSSTVIKEIDSA